ANDSGQMAFILKLKAGIGDANTNNDQVLWTGTPGNLTPVAREGDLLPANINAAGDTRYATGDPILTFTNGGVSNDGSLYYLSKLSGSTITTSLNDFALIKYNSSSSPQYTLIMQRNDPTGITDVNFGLPNTTGTRMNNSGTVLLQVALQGPAVTT